MRDQLGQASVVDLPVRSQVATADYAGGGLSLADLLFMLGRYKWFIVACTLLGLTIAGIYVVLATPIYEATASMRIDPQRATSLGLSDLISGAAIQNSDLLQTEISILKSDVVAMDTLNSLSDKEFEQYAHFSKHQLNMTQGATALPPQQERLLIDMKGSLNAKQVEGTQLVSITFQDASPAVAATMVNHAMAAYLRQSFDSRYGSVRQVSQWLSDQLDSLKDRAADAQRRLSDFQEQNDILGTDAENNTTIDRLRELNTKLTDAEADRMFREAQMRAAESGSPAVLGSMISNPELQSLQTQQGALYAQYAQLSTKFGPNYPPLAELKAQMEAVDQEVAKRVDSVRGRLRQDYSASMNTEQMLKQQYDAQTSKAYALNRKQAEYAVLLAEAKSNQDLYDTLQYKLQQAGVDAGLNGVNTMIVDKARVPLRPIKPKKMLILSFGLLLGLFAGVGASFLKEAITDNVHSAEQIERSVGYFLIAGIPKFVAAPAESKTEGSTQLAPKLVSYLAPQSRDAEAYRSLRNNVLLSALDHPYKSILITSSLPSEGKSTVASNYAIVLAQRGARVLAIDADLRRPRLHQLMGLTNETGLSDLLIGEVRSGAFKQPFRDLPNLSVLTAGRKVALPSEALGSHQLRTMIEGWKNQFDVIVLDSAPILAVSDTLPLTSYMEAVILVARFDQTPIRALRRTRDMLSRTHANVVGVVMNQVSELASSYGGYYGYGEYYE